MITVIYFYNCPSIFPGELVKSKLQYVTYKRVKEKVTYAARKIYDTCETDSRKW